MHAYIHNLYFTNVQLLPMKISLQYNYIFSMMLLGIQADLEDSGNTKLVNTGPYFL